MGAFLDKPKTEKTNDTGDGKDFKYVVASMQGWRTDMEDAHQVKVGLSEHDVFKSWSFFAVFDGHAGSKVAMHSSEYLLEYLLDTQEFKELVEELSATGGSVSEKARELITSGMKTGFLKLDEHLSKEDDSGEKEKSGTTAVCAILSPEYIFFGNLGDSRGLLCRSASEFFATMDHKPYLEHERERIVKAGGTVMIQRVNGSLAVSRALGDFEYKSVPGLKATEQLVSPEPDVYVVKRDTSDDQFLVLACDGIYDVLENQELCQLLRSRLLVTDDLKAVSNQILDFCLARGSRDNMTMVLVIFEAAPKKDEQFAEAEARWLEKVKAKAVEFVDRTKDSLKDYDATNLIMQIRSETNLDESPLFGGLELAKAIVDEVIEEFKSHSSPTSNEHADDILPAQQHQEIQNENNGA
ncbi:PPM-type phosphatase domain-containing protein [Aphelenchoides bicaudatus]|nr:PPM-type phosphatase domain-containing protein [Aphelenchoides bicaudatus]